MKHRSLDVVMDDDAFIDALAQGVDPSAGDDELAGLFLALREETHAPMPPAPVLDTALPPVLDTTPAVTTQMPAVGASASSGSAGTGSEVNELQARRERKRPRVSAFVSGLAGAAAATLVIAGGGAAIYSAQPGSPLWGMNTALFGDHAAVVELATTLEEVDYRTSQGDIEGAKKLLEQAKELANAKKMKDPAPGQELITTVTAPATTTTVTETAIATATQEAEKPEASEPTTPAPATTVTATVTVVQAPGAAEPEPTTTEVPLPEVLDPPTVQPAPQPAVQPGAQQVPDLEN